jgi:hypothetical protein
MNLDDPQLRLEAEAIKRRFETAGQRAREERERGLRALAQRYDLRQVDLITLTGYSRETIRQAMDPAKRDEIRARRRSEASETVAYDAARSHIGVMEIDEVLKDRTALDAVAILASIDPQDDEALNRIAHALALDLPRGIVKIGPLRRAVKAAAEALERTAE